ncbi:sigma 54-interacting transcriptional regulator [Pectobacterium brasiliense]|uniref:sigma 54-interacting transcriptional regulator n=1 Tax=Pectobacterium brasiliense TaxID=180957 RepID=UPI002DD43EAB|nr:sigma 54-interacting transcriptional regulator [Pectobacterium brasiliense]
MASELIAFLAQDEEMYQSAQTLLASKQENIRFEKGALEDCVACARELIKNGIEIIITRAAAAAAIRAASLQVSLVEISVTTIDTVRAIQKAKDYGSRIAVISYPHLINELDFLSASLQTDIRLYPIHSVQDIPIQVAKILADDIDVIVGGYIAKRISQAHNIPFEFVHNGPSSIIQAAEQAKLILHAKNLEKAKTELFSAVLDYAYEGILSVDVNARITSFNPQAEAITGLEKHHVTGKKLDEIWPELKIKSMISSGRDELGEIIGINGTEILCNKIPIIVNGKTVGAVVTFQNIARIQQMENQVRQRILGTGHNAEKTFQQIEKTSHALKSTIDMAKQFALTDSSILITGETGTGKEVFAQSIHNYSLQANGPFVAINCAALPSHILESELFGYDKGAFTGADPKGKPGVFELAHNGTLFLDEIAEMEYAIQGKILRVLQERVIRRLGSAHTIPVNVRFIAATNNNLVTYSICRSGHCR